MTDLPPTVTERGSNSRGFAPVIFTTGLIAGALDILGAILLHSYLLSNARVIQVLQAIASGVFGKEAFKGGWKMAIYGLIFHFIIALAFTGFYVYIFSNFSFVRKNKIISGLIFGIFVWSIMNFLILPLTLANPSSTKWTQALSGILVLMFFFGLPISLMVHRFYNKNAYSRISEFYALH